MIHVTVPVCGKRTLRDRAQLHRERDAPDLVTPGTFSASLHGYDPSIRHSLTRETAMRRRRLGRRSLIPIGAALLAGVGVVLAAGGLREADHLLDRLAGESCIGCHIERQPLLVGAVKRSAHFGADVSCEDCHGEDHEAMFGQDGEVSAEVCAATCHAKEYEQFKRSGHSESKAGRRSDLLTMYPGRVGGCELDSGCHASRKVHDDGSAGKCSICHPSHSFSMEVTRDPAICVTCHSGSNNTEVTEYEKSIHGVLYRTGGEEVGGVTCVTCHMPGGRHDEDFNLTDVEFRPGDGPLHFVKTMPEAEFQEKREAMLALCTPCHGAKLAKRALIEADDFRRAGAYALEEASVIVHQLYEEGLLDPMPGERTPNPFSGSVLELGPNQLFDREMSMPERIFYRMYMFTYSAAWRRAYHNTPLLVTWHENEMLKNDLIELRAEASRVRVLARAGVITPRPPSRSEAALYERLPTTK